MSLRLAIQEPQWVIHRTEIVENMSVEILGIGMAHGSVEFACVRFRRTERWIGGISVASRADGVGFGVMAKRHRTIISSARP